MFIQYENKMINLSKVNMIWTHITDNYRDYNINFRFDCGEKYEINFEKGIERDEVLNQIIDILSEKNMLYKLHA